MVNDTTKKSFETGTFAVLAVLLILMGVFFVWLARQNAEQAVGLPLLAIVGLVTLIITLALAAIAFAQVDLDDKSQPLGLPDGSVRAVIALGLLVLFAIITIFLYNDRGSRSYWTAPMTETALAKLVQEVPAQRILKQEPVDVAVKTYRVQLIDTDRQASDRFADQLLTILGTLLSSVAGFYFGASSGPRQTRPSGQSLTLQGISPNAIQKTAAAQVIDLQVTGLGLDAVTNAKLVRGAKELVATNVVSNAGLVKAKITIDSAVDPGDWDVVVTDKDGRTATLPAALKIT